MVYCAGRVGGVGAHTLEFVFADIDGGGGVGDVGDEVVYHPE